MRFQPREPGKRDAIIGFGIVAVVIFAICFAAGLSAEAAAYGVVALGLIAAIGQRIPKGRPKPAKLVRPASLPTHPRTIPQSVKIQVAARDGAACRNCGSEHELQYDHIYPYSLGGSSLDVNNIQILCGRCNRRKGNR